MKELIKIFFDGGVKGDEIAGAYVAKSSVDDKILFSNVKKMIGSTNNQAEYGALILAIEDCIHRGISNVIIYGDSQLVVCQISGKYKVRNCRLRFLHQKAMGLLKQFNQWTINWVCREENQEADALINKLFNRK